jgi:hypothetical protein
MHPLTNSKEINHNREYGYIMNLEDSTTSFIVPAYHSMIYSICIRRIIAKTLIAIDGTVDVYMMN